MRWTSFQHSVNVSFRKASSLSTVVAWLKCCSLQGEHTFLSSTQRFVWITQAWGGTVLLQFPSDSQLSHSKACTQTWSPTLSTETKRHSEVWGVRWKFRPHNLFRLFSKKTPAFPEFLRWHHAVMCSFNYNCFLMWYFLLPVDFYLNGSSIANLIFSPQHQLQTKSNRNLTKKYVFYVLLNSVTGKEKVMIPQENVYITFDSVCFPAIWDALVG